MLKMPRCKCRLLSDRFFFNLLDATGDDDTNDDDDDDYGAGDDDANHDEDGYFD